jgi:hypothetical protein
VNCPIIKTQIISSNKNIDTHGGRGRGGLGPKFFVIKMQFNMKKGETPRFSDNPKYPSKEFGQNTKDPPPGFPNTAHQ